MWVNKKRELRWLDSFMDVGFKRIIANYIIIYQYKLDETKAIYIKIVSQFENEDTNLIRYRIIKITPEIKQMLVDKNYNFIEKEVKLLENDIRKEKFLNDF